MLKVEGAVVALECLYLKALAKSSASPFANPSKVSTPLASGAGGGRLSVLFDNERLCTQTCVPYNADSRLKYLVSRMLVS